MTPLVVRTLVLLAVATLVVVAAAALGIPELRTSPDPHPGMAALSAPTQTASGAGR